MLSILTTGGTIACTQDEAGALVPTITGAELARAAGLSDVDVNDVVRLDSSSITLAELDDVIARVHNELERTDVEAVVLTHGTDSMEETALALDLMHTWDKPVVITGAQRSFDHPETDGPKNLAGAAAAGRTLTPGVYVHFGSRTLPARGLRKAHTHDLDAFVSEPHGARPAPCERVLLDGFHVPIVAMYPGAPASVVAAVAATGVDGLVVAAMGSGNVSEQAGQEIGKLLEQDIPVVIATRVGRGPTELAYGGPGGGSTLADQGALASGPLSAAQARIALIVALAAGRDPRELLL
ncbi:asparaginase [Corynebacterium tapiri]|uniref:asparaginase n=1 Tax=Corynebacterium tapiri TaxID=1448266 RepID=A0A5C4U6K3_9CORY|nr:asparaginase [Corynebacterium tapiri]TNL99387.1 asparaginase [Corynebacterium tapiri]